MAEIETQRRALTAATQDAIESTHPALLDYATLLRLLTDPERHPAITAALAAGAFEDESYDATWAYASCSTASRRSSPARRGAPPGTAGAGPRMTAPTS